MYNINLWVAWRVGFCVFSLLHPPLEKRQPIFRPMLKKPTAPCTKLQKLYKRMPWFWESGGCSDKAFKVTALQ
ncbi:MAG: hypothetical protein NWE95_01670 [Candidatus Bathyarchaeota archaeon]|nr:hypothetical protein [Candidatus Bathyarchaeota archaeon]